MMFCDETERIQAVVGGVGKTRGERSALNDPLCPGAIGMGCKKRLDLVRLGLAGCRIRLRRSKLFVEIARRPDREDRARASPRSRGCCIGTGLSPTAAAKQLGRGRSTVYREVNRAGIERYPAGARSLETAVGFASGELDA